MFTRHRRATRAKVSEATQVELRREERRRARNAAGHLLCKWQLTEQGDLVASWHRDLPGAPGTRR